MIRMRVGVVVAVLAVSGCGSSVASTGGAAAAPRPQEVQITYMADLERSDALLSEVEKNLGVKGRGDLTYTTASGVEQQAGVDLPLSDKNGGEPGVQVQIPSGSPVVFSVQSGVDSGTVRCRITGSNGAVIAENESSGPYVVASCQGVAQ